MNKTSLNIKMLYDKLGKAEKQIANWMSLPSNAVVVKQP